MDFLTSRVRGRIREKNSGELGDIILLDNRFSTVSSLKAFEVLAFNLFRGNTSLMAPSDTQQPIKACRLKNSQVWHCEPQLSVWNGIYYHFEGRNTIHLKHMQLNHFSLLNLFVEMSFSGIWFRYWIEKVWRILNAFWNFILARTPEIFIFCLNYS